MPENKRVVHVVGTGTIGEPLIGLLAHFKEPLGIDEVTFHKRTPLVTDRSKVRNLIRRGAQLAVDDARRSGFLELGIEPTLETEEALERAAVVIDCTPVGNDNKAKKFREFFEGVGGTVEDLDDGTFKQSGTGTSAKLVIIDKEDV